MPIETLQAVISAVWYASLGLYLVCSFWRDFAVKGSRKRYIGATGSITASLLTIGTSVLLGVIEILNEQYGLAAGYVFTILLHLFLLWFYHDDDNWFNDQRKRLKKGWRRLKQRLASIKLSPIPLPSPA